MRQADSSAASTVLRFALARRTTVLPCLPHAPAAGVNVAVLWGFGLIAAAFVLALVYGWLCRTDVATKDETGERRT